MRHYFMPEVLKRGDKIIIWGAGCMGRQLLSMSKKKGIEVVRLLDSLADLTPKLNHDILTELPNVLEAMNEKEYDYIIVAVENHEIQKEIVNILNGWGIDINKVIVGTEYYDDVLTLDAPEVRAKCMLHFSWHGEDMIIANIFYKMGIKNPSYLDVGCNDPILGSNTAYFYITGSRGVCVDANPEMISRMKITRSDDLALCMGVVPKEGEGKKIFHVLEKDGLSTFNESFVEEYHLNHSMEYNNVNNKNIEVDTHSLNYIVEKYCNNVWPDFLDVDIEGFDDEVIQGTIFAENGPKVICIESHNSETREYISSQGYELYTYTILNDIWIRKTER